MPTFHVVRTLNSSPCLDYKATSELMLIVDHFLIVVRMERSPVGHLSAHWWI